MEGNRNQTCSGWRFNADVFISKSISFVSFHFIDCTKSCHDYRDVVSSVVIICAHLFMTGFVGGCVRFQVGICCTSVMKLTIKRMHVEPNF